MLFSFMKSCFNWLPLPLYRLVSTIFTIFAAMILVEVIKLLIMIFNFLKDVVGGLLTKVVEFFV